MLLRWKLFFRDYEVYYGKTGLFVCNLACEWRFERMRALRVTNCDMVENNALPARRIRLDHLGPKLDTFDTPLWLVLRGARLFIMFRLTFP